MSKNKKWYKRTHDFAPYTRADGQAVSDEFDAIQASFERIPAMRDDGLGFEVSPIIPDGTADNHPISMRQLREGEQSVLQMKNAVTEKARQVAENTRTTATNTQTAVDAKEQAVSSAQQSANAAQTATEKAQQAHQAKESIHGVEERVNALKQATETTAQQVSADALLARRWASRPEGRPVEGTLHSARHYAIQAQRSAQAAANTETRLNAAASSVEGKIDKTAISDSVSSSSRTHVGSSFAVKTAYDKGVEAKNAADNASQIANAKQSPSTTLAGYGITDFVVSRLGKRDLNDVQVAGLYGQATDADALVARHYPVQEAGALLVSPSAYGWQQEYTTFDSKQKFIRNKQYGGGWSAWKGLVQESEFTSFKQLLIGIPFPYPLGTVPENCLAFYGQVFDKQRYPVLAQRYPTGRLPDLRGEFIRGWDNGRGIDAQRVLLSAQDDQFKAHQHFVETISSRGWGSSSSDGYGSSSDQYYSQHNATSVEGDDETRPRNIAFHYICLAG